MDLTPLVDIILLLITFVRGVTFKQETPLLPILPVITYVSEIER